MGKLYQRSFLGDAPDRLQQLLDLDGLLELDLELGIRPSLLIGDATGPGYNRFRNRRFGGTSSTAAAGRYGIACTTAIRSEGLVVTGMLVDVRVASSTVWWRLMTNAEAVGVWPGLLAGAANVRWVDNADGTFAPACLGIAAPGGVAVPTTANGKAQFVNGNSAIHFGLEVFINPGQVFEVGAVAATAELDVTFFGRAF